MAATREHFVIAVRRHERIHFLLWCEGEASGVLVVDGRLLAFPTDGDARAHATSAALVVSPDRSAYFDLDELSAWLDAPNPHRIRAGMLDDIRTLLAAVACVAGDEVAAARLAVVSSGDTVTPLRHGLACFDQALSRSLPDPAPERR